ncbi:MAG: hypothetical protein IT361_12250 [Gemmatimonadaceae bacterium]|nr:hypothetical protein [Gemmatimonadaceae bacterium]
MTASGTIRVLVCAALLGGAAACASSVGRSRVVAEAGTYDYVMRTGETGDLRGRLVVDSGTVVLEPESGRCRTDPGSANIGSAVYLCDNSVDIGDLRVTIDRRNPLHRSSWTGWSTRSVTREVCDRYAADQAGRRVCVASRREQVEERVRVGGSLDFTRRPTT